MSDNNAADFFEDFKWDLPPAVITGAGEDVRYPYASAWLTKVREDNQGYDASLPDSGKLHDFYTSFFGISLQTGLVYRRANGALVAISVLTRMKKRKGGSVEREWSVLAAQHLYMDRWIHGIFNKVKKTAEWRIGKPTQLKAPSTALHRLLTMEPANDPTSFALDAWRWRIIGGYDGDLHDEYGVPDPSNATYSNWFGCHPDIQSPNQRPIFSTAETSVLTRKQVWTPATRGTYKRLPDPWRRDEFGLRKEFRSNLVVQVIHLHRHALVSSYPEDAPHAPEGYKWYNWFTISRCLDRDDMGLFADRDFARSEPLTMYDGYVYSAGRDNKRPVGFARVGFGVISLDTKLNDNYDVSIEKLHGDPDLHINVDAGDYDVYDEETMKIIHEDIRQKEFLKGGMHYLGAVQAPRLGRRPWQFAHKMNHDPRRKNAIVVRGRDTLPWGDYYGIGFLSTTRDVRRNEELFLDYGYDVNEGLFDPDLREQMLEISDDNVEPVVTQERLSLIEAALKQDYTVEQAPIQALHAKHLDVQPVGQRFDGALVGRLAMLSIGRTKATPRPSAAAAPLRRPASLRTPGRR